MESRNPKKLNLGCGNKPMKNWLNHDLVPLPGVDVVHDLRQFPWPFENEQFDKVRMKHILEHLPDTIRTMEELYRIIRPGASVEIAVPYWNSADAIGDITHERLFMESSFNFFDPRTRQCIKRPYYSTARFYITSIGVVVRIMSKDYTVFNFLVKKIILLLAHYLCNVVKILVISLERI